MTNETCKYIGEKESCKKATKNGTHRCDVGHGDARVAETRGERTAAFVAILLNLLLPLAHKESADRDSEDRAATQRERDNTNDEKNSYRSLSPWVTDLCKVLAHRAFEDSLSCWCHRSGDARRAQRVFTHHTVQLFKGGKGRKSNCEQDSEEI